MALGVESTFNWYWFVDGLREQGRNVKLGNPAKMEQYKGIKITNDLMDADWLAEQLRLGIFPLRSKGNPAAPQHHCLKRGWPVTSPKGSGTPQGKPL